MTKAENIQEIVDNRLKVPNGFFKWAKNDFPIYEWSNKSKTIISSDRKKFSEKVTKRLSLNSRLTFVGDTFTMSGWESQRNALKCRCIL